MYKVYVTKDQALQKVKLFCAYQERSHSETKEKLYSFGLSKNEVDELLSQLIVENYLNEERFAIAFAGGHFRTKQWGKVKIQYALTQKKVSAYCIKKALAQIDKTDYEQCLEKLANAKMATLKNEKNIFSKKSKLQNYLMQKGYEGSLVGALINRI
jgi:regulatory protein